MTNKMLTRLFEGYVHAVRHEGIKNLDCVYKSYSTAKSRAWYEVGRIHGVHTMTVLSHNGWFFTLGYLYMPKADSYEGMTFVYQTHCHKHTLKLTPEQIGKVCGTAYSPEQYPLVPRRVCIDGTWTDISMPGTSNED